MNVVVRALQRAGSSSYVAVQEGAQLLTYNRLLGAADSLGQSFSRFKGVTGVIQHAPRIGCLADAGSKHVVGAWSTWLQGCIFVPLSPGHPDPLLRYEMEDARLSTVRHCQKLLVEDKYLDRVKDWAQNAGVALQRLPSMEGTAGPSWDAAHIDATKLRTQREALLDSGSLILYTSGTTGNPKGVLHTHRSLTAQMDALTVAWRWRSSDKILHALPVHHIHGLVNALMCAHYNGATVSFQQPFNSRNVWGALCKKDISVLMGVPSMYSHMLQIYKHFSEERQAECRDAAAALRLAVCGSSACPVPVMRQWQELAGENLLERYGMTETGMVLSNPYAGPREPGTVGAPLHGVQVRLVSEQAEQLESPVNTGNDAVAGDASTNSADAAESGAAPARKRRRWFWRTPPEKTPITLHWDPHDSSSQQDHTASHPAASVAPLAGRALNAQSDLRRRAPRAMATAAAAAQSDSTATGSTAERLVHGSSSDSTGSLAEGSAQLAVKGDCLFKEYWNNPEATQASFDADGFFLTGDTARTVDVAGTPNYQILGRTSVDIIKCGGFKLSALRIENVLLDHPKVAELAVLGLPDDVHGEKVALVAALKEGETLGLGELVSWCTDRLTLHELPRDLRVVPQLQRNAMGKVNKKQLKKLFA